MNNNQIIGLMVLGLGGFYLYNQFLRQRTKYVSTDYTPVPDRSNVSYPASTETMVPEFTGTYQDETGMDWSILTDLFKVQEEKPYMSTSDTARGIRNNNPGNIKKSSDNWQGAVGVDGPFVVFSSALYGIRAITKILQSYRRRGIVTLSQIIDTWAPPDIGGDDNPTLNYINSVSQWSGIDVNQVVDSFNYPVFIAGIIRFENGDQPYTMSYIHEGISMA